MLRKLLVVDGPDKVFLTLKEALTQGGFRIVGPVGNGRDAMILAEAERPHVAVIDWSLERGEATGLVASLSGRGIPSVAVTGSSVRSIDLLEVAAVLPRPIETERLLALLSQVERVD